MNSYTLFVEKKDIPVNESLLNYSPYRADALLYSTSLLLFFCNFFLGC